MKNFLMAGVLLLGAGLLFAQQGGQQAAGSLAEPDPAAIGTDSAKQYLREVSVDLFEREASWNARISPDDGYVTARLFDGGPAGKEPFPAGVPEETVDKMVFGVKVEFFKRGINTFFINAARPLPIEGVTKTISVWVAGRNFNHFLTVVVRDCYGSTFEIPVGYLNFTGWKKMTAAVPVSPDAVHGVVQLDTRSLDRSGLSILGFRVDCDPMEAYGSYYIYFDDLRAVTDLYAAESRDKDDMSDYW